MNRREREGLTEWRKEQKRSRKEENGEKNKTKRKKDGAAGEKEAENHWKMCESDLRHHAIQKSFPRSQLIAPDCSSADVEAIDAISAFDSE